MASEITVQTIRGPASGANANKILIPAGQTLDASNGFVPPAGSVIQVVQGTTITAVFTTSSSFVATALQATITPSSTSSKILIISREQLNGDIDNDGLGDATGEYALYRNGSAIITSITSAWARGGLQRINDAGFKYLDSPNSTSALTYATYIRMAGGSRHVTSNNDALSTMILMEIAG
jgi:hypothetical protein